MLVRTLEKDPEHYEMDGMSGMDHDTHTHHCLFCDAVEAGVGRDDEDSDETVVEEHDDNDDPEAAAGGHDEDWEVELILALELVAAAVLRYRKNYLDHDIADSDLDIDRGVVVVLVSVVVHYFDVHDSDDYDFDWIHSVQEKIKDSEQGHLI